MAERTLTRVSAVGHRTRKEVAIRLKGRRSGLTLDPVARHVRDEVHLA